MPLPPGPGEGNKICITLPWARMVAGIEAIYDPSGEPPRPMPNWTAAETPANVKWELSTWFNPIEADELFTDGAYPTPNGNNCSHVTDVLPSGARAAAEGVAGTNCCINDLNQDGVVNPADTNILFGIFPRSMLKDPCPDCY